MLLANAGHTVSTDRLLIQVWGHATPLTGSFSSSWCTDCAKRSKSIPPLPSYLQTPPARVTTRSGISGAGPSPHDAVTICIIQL